MRWPASLRTLIVETLDGLAWVGVTPCALWGVRPVFLPPLPFLRESHELNFGTHVHLDGMPGVWFFSPDPDNPAAWGARAALPGGRPAGRLGLAPGKGAIGRLGAFAGARFALLPAGYDMSEASERR